LNLLASSSSSDFSLPGGLLVLTRISSESKAAVLESAALAAVTEKTANAANKKRVFRKGTPFYDRDSDRTWKKLLEAGRQLHVNAGG
jgi:hypothetical protein